MCCVKGKSLCIYLSKFREMVEDHSIEEVSSHQTTTNQTHFIWYNYSVGCVAHTAELNCATYIHTNTVSHSIIFGKLNSLFFFIA